MELTVIKTNRHPDNIHPANNFVKIRAEKDPERVGSIILSQDLPGSIQCGFATGEVLEVGSKVKYSTKEELLGKRVVYRRFMKDAVSFLETTDSKVFLLNVEDIYLILDDPNIEIGVI